MSWGEDEQFIFWDYLSGEKRKVLSFIDAIEENKDLFVISEQWTRNDSNIVQIQSNTCILYDEQLQHQAVWAGEGYLQSQFITNDNDIYVIENRSQIHTLQIHPPSSD